MEASFSVLLFVTLEISIACEQDDIRLENGLNKFEGRVEVCDGGYWKTVCSNMWDNAEASVACRQIGFAGISSSTATRDLQFGEGAEGMTKAGWDCLGNEDKLLDCQMSNTTCNSDEVAGVLCFGMMDNCTEEDIRLSNHASGSGRVEVCLDGHWGTVCDDGWDILEASTVCKQLEFNERGIPTRMAYFGDGNGPIHLSRAQCTSDNSRLTECVVNKTGINGCKHNEDAGVICLGNTSCQDGVVRLINGNTEREGRVEICYNGVWGTVCDYGWDEVDASVVCIQSGYGQTGLATRNSHFGAGEGPVLLNNVACNHNHTQLFQCVHKQSIGIHRCTNNNIAGVICQEVTTFPHKPTTTESSSLATLGSTTLGSTMVSSTLGPTTAGSTQGTFIPNNIIVNSETETTTSPTQNIMETRTGSTTAVPFTLVLQSAIPGAVGGALVVGTFATVVIVSLVLLLFKRRTKDSMKDGLEKGSTKTTVRSMDHPNFRDGVVLCSFDHEKDGQNALNFKDNSYSPNKTNSFTPQYEALYSENTVTVIQSTDTQYESIISGTFGNEQGLINSGTKERIISEPAYELPTHLNEGVDNCYSTLGPTDYSILEPHIPKVKQQPPPPDNDQYSQLQH